jgi:methionyl-tRNA synthetase
MTQQNNLQYQCELDEAKKAKKTGFIKFGQDAIEAGFLAEYYFIKGEQVTKEAFILGSGMEHLIKDASTVKCTRCGRHESPDQYKSPCGRTFGADTCQGIFF